MHICLCFSEDELNIGSFRKFRENLTYKEEENITDTPRVEPIHVHFWGY